MLSRWLCRCTEDEDFLRSTEVSNTLGHGQLELLSAVGVPAKEQGDPLLTLFPPWHLSPLKLRLFSGCMLIKTPASSALKMFFGSYSPSNEGRSAIQSETVSSSTVFPSPEAVL